MIRAREVTTRSAGFVEESGNIDDVEEGDGAPCCGERKVLEWENVGFGVTGPMERREAAK